MKTRVLGKGGLEVSAIGLGCMTLGKDYSPESRKNGINMIREAFDLGVTMFDTAVVYQNGLNEELVGEALQPIRHKVAVATKCGIRFENGEMIRDGSPEAVRQSLEASLKRLKTDYVDLLYIHRVDPATPIEVTAGAMVQLHKEGKLRNWGISEPSMDVLRRANGVFPVAAIESEYSMMWRYPESEILPTLEALSVGLVPYRPLAEGFLTNGTDGMFANPANASGVTRFSSESLKTNMALREWVQDMAAEKGITAAQLSLAWLLAQKPFIVPIPGTSKPGRMRENILSAQVSFTDRELQTLRSLLDATEIVGTRYVPNTPSARSVMKI